VLVGKRRWVKKVELRYSCIPPFVFHF